MDKRLAPRFDTSINLLVQVIDSPDPSLIKQTSTAVTIDVSERGLRIISACALLEGSVVDLWVKSILPDIPNYFLSGEVIRTHLAPLKEGFCYGIKLYSFKNDDFRRWKHWLMRIS